MILHKKVINGKEMLKMYLTQCKNRDRTNTCVRCVFVKVDITSGLIYVMYIIVTMEIPVFIVKQPELKLTPVDNKRHGKYNRKKTNDQTRNSSYKQSTLIACYG
jgi:hypothetical protein